MKKFMYKYLSAEINQGTEESPDIKQIFINKSMTYSEVNEEIVKREAYNGVYEIVDDGQPEPDTTTTDDVLNALLGV